MIKKIAAAVAVLAMCMPLAVQAAPEYHFGDAVLESESGTITICGLDELDSETSAVILAGYDENGDLVGTQYLTVENDECAGKEIDSAVSYKMGRVTNFESNFVELNIITVQDGKSTPQPTVTETPSESEAPAATSEPTASEAPTATYYPALAAPLPGPPYERSLDAYFTFAVIKNVSSSTGDDGPEYLVDVLREGKEETLTVPTDAEIVVSSDYYSYMTGSDASALQEGDIVYFERNSAGTKIKSMAFIYRPVRENIITSSENYGTNFERLFSTNGRVYGSPANEAGTVIRYGAKEGSNRYRYAFGAVLERGGGYFSLINRSGVVDNAIEISTTKDTIVYTCDMASRRDRLGIANQSAISKSGIPKSAYDEDGNITFSNEYPYTYAYARVVNGVATEVVIYTGYGE